MELNPYKEIVRRYTNEKLLEMLNEKRQDYAEEAIDAVEEVLQERGVTYTRKPDDQFPPRPIPEDKQAETEYIEKIYVSNKPLRFLEYLIDQFVIDLLCAAYVVDKYSIAESDYDVLYNTYYDVYAEYLIIYLAYYFILEAIFRQTVGKLILGMQVVGADGKRPSVLAILMRTLFRLIPFEAFSFLFSRWKNGRLVGSWHDKLTQTYVVKTSKIKKYNKEREA